MFAIRSKEYCGGDNGVCVCMYKAQMCIYPCLISLVRKEVYLDRQILIVTAVVSLD